MCFDFTCVFSVLCFNPITGFALKTWYTHRHTQRNFYAQTEKIWQIYVTLPWPAWSNGGFFVSIKNFSKAPNTDNYLLFSLFSSSFFQDYDSFFEAKESNTVYSFLGLKPRLASKVGKSFLVLKFIFLELSLRVGIEGFRGMHLQSPKFLNFFSCSNAQSGTAEHKNTRSNPGFFFSSNFQLLLCIRVYFYLPFILLIIYTPSSKKNLRQ